jgi:hypothetical protein
MPHQETSDEYFKEIIKTSHPTTGAVYIDTPISIAHDGSDKPFTLKEYLSRYAKNRTGDPMIFYDNRLPHSNAMLAQFPNPTMQSHLFVLYPTEGEHTDIPIALASIAIQTRNKSAKERTKHLYPDDTDLASKTPIEVTNIQNISAQHPDASQHFSDIEIISKTNAAFANFCASPSNSRHIAPIPFQGEITQTKSEHTPTPLVKRLAAMPTDELLVHQLVKQLKPAPTRTR